MDGRPFSADGEGTNGTAKEMLIGDEKPGVISRRFTTDGPVDGFNGMGVSTTVGAGAGVGVEGGMKKKKKFASLRRIFRLDD